MTRSEIVNAIDAAVANNNQLNVYILGLDIQIYNLQTLAVGGVTTQRYQEFYIPGKHTGRNRYLSKEQLIDFLVEYQIEDRINHALLDD